MVCNHLFFCSLSFFKDSFKDKYLWDVAVVVVLQEDVAVVEVVVVKWMYMIGYQICQFLKIKKIKL